MTSIVKLDDVTPTGELARVEGEAVVDERVDEPIEHHVERDETHPRTPKKFQWRRYLVLGLFLR